ncbi:fimbrial protein StaE [Salmonella enterica]
MKKQVLRGVILGALATMTAGVSTMTQADGTASLDLTVNANITAGTCSASVLDGETATDTIAFGNVYISEVFAKTKVKSFKLRFSDCAGLKDKKASLVIAPRDAGCAGSDSINAEFANASTATSKAQRTAVELWTTDTPEGSNSVQFHCRNKNAQEIDLSSTSSTTPVDYPLSARMVPVTGYAITALTAGDFYSPTTFTITYQ